MAVPVAVLISVCAQDRLDWFAAAVESIVNQDYQGGEIRIYLGIDGPIPVGLEVWLEQHRDAFFKVCRNPVNSGLSKTLNLLLRKVEDEPFLFRMDADDLCLPYRFSRQVEYLHDNPEIEVLGGAVWEFDDNAVAAWQKSYPRDPHAIAQYICRANPMAHSTVCFRRRFFDKIAAYPETSRYNQDLALWFAALKGGVKMANLGLPIVCLRTSQAFYSRRGVKRAASELRYYLCGIHSLYGVTWRMIFPLSRFLFRLMPAGLIGLVYRSRLRARICR